MRNVGDAALMLPGLRSLRARWLRWRPVARVMLGAFWTAAALFLIVIAIIVFQQQSNEQRHRHKEAVTVRLACERSMVFGRPLIDFLAAAEADLHTGVLDRELVVHGKRQSVLSYYRASVPRSCPSK